MNDLTNDELYILLDSIEGLMDLCDGDDLDKYIALHNKISSELANRVEINT